MAKGLMSFWNNSLLDKHKQKLPLKARLLLMGNQPGLRLP